MSLFMVVQLIAIVRSISLVIINAHTVKSNYTVIIVKLLFVMLDMKNVYYFNYRI